MPYRRILPNTALFIKIYRNHGQLVGPSSWQYNDHSISPFSPILDLPTNKTSLRVYRRGSRHGMEDIEVASIQRYTGTYSLYDSLYTTYSTALNDNSERTTPELE